MRNIIKTKNKRGLSEIVAYVMLVVMSLSLASGVYIWLKNYVPPDKETCSEEISLSIKNYTCQNDLHKITLTIENKGFFSVKGFFIMGSNKTSNLPVIPLYQEDIGTVNGSYTFGRGVGIGKLLPATYETMSFRYDRAIPLLKIRLQPFIVGEKTKTLVLCDQGIVTQEIPPGTCI